MNRRLNRLIAATVIGTLLLAFIGCASPIRSSYNLLNAVSALYDTFPAYYPILVGQGVVSQGEVDSFDQTFDTVLDSAYDTLALVKERQAAWSQYESHLKLLVALLEYFVELTGVEDSAFNAALDILLKVVDVN